MSPDDRETTTVQMLLDRLAAGDESAVDDLIGHAVERLRHIAHKLLQENPNVRRWEATDDLLQNSLLRLHRALKAVKPADERHFINLAVQHIRHELIDLARHHFGPEGDAAHHISNPKVTDSGGDQRPLVEVQADSGPGPGTELGQRESLKREDKWVHQVVERLPDDERQVFDLAYYFGLDQATIAKRLGVSVPTVKRRYMRAKLILADTLGANDVDAT